MHHAALIFFRPQTIVHKRACSAGLIALLLCTMSPQHARAQDVPPALSRYVQDTVDRSNAGIAYAWAVESSMMIGMFAVGGWMRQMTGVVTRYIRSDVQVVRQRQNLLTDSACLRADQIVLELQMEKIRSNLKKALEAKSIFAISLLEDNLEFVNKRYEALLTGARDPAYIDTTWYKKWPFEPPKTQVWCCPIEGDNDICSQTTSGACTDEGGMSFDTLQECTTFGCRKPEEKKEEPVCPFHSDYLPPSLNGYGCDSEALMLTLDRFPKDTPFARSAFQELRALLLIQNAMEGKDKIGNLVGGIVNGQNPIDLKRKHVALSGCIMNGWCERAPDTACTGPSDCPNKTRCIDARSIGVCDNAQGRQCRADSDCAQGGKCRRLSDALQVELRGAFSLEKNQTGLLHAFRRLRENDGADRTFSESYALDNNFPVINTLARYFRNLFAIFSREQGSREAATFAVGSDPVLSSTTSFKELHNSIALLGRLASGQDGIRGFVRDYAYFLRRSCTDRPCTQRLERILKIVFKDECFRFVSGAFLGDTEEEPGWKKCMEAAQINELR